MNYIFDNKYCNNYNNALYLSIYIFNIGVTVHNYCCQAKKNKNITIEKFNKYYLRGGPGPTSCWSWLPYTTLGW